MSKKIGIYDLNNAFYLTEDIDAILTHVGELYDVNFLKSSNTYIPKTSNNSHWASQESHQIFNSLVPKFKTITKDMYSVLEGVFTHKYGKFDKPGLEQKYQYLKELRLFNNKLKHHNNREAEINLLKFASIDNNKHLLDCQITFKYRKAEKIDLIRFVNLIDVFLHILEEENIIVINRFSK